MGFLKNYTKQQSKKHWFKILIAAAVAFLLFGNQGFRQLLRNKLELNRAQTQLQGLKTHEKALLSELKRLKNDPAYLEKTARQELGLIKPGEVEYRFKKPNK